MPVRKSVSEMAAHSRLNAHRRELIGEMGVDQDRHCIADQWFTFFDRNGDGSLSQAEVFEGLASVLQFEASPELVRPVRHLFAAFWNDWASPSDGLVKKRAFLRSESGLADVLAANLQDYFPRTGFTGTLPALPNLRDVLARRSLERTSSLGLAA